MMRVAICGLFLLINMSAFDDATKELKKLFSLGIIIPSPDFHIETLPDKRQMVHARPQPPSHAGGWVVRVTYSSIHDPDEAAIFLPIFLAKGNMLGSFINEVSACGSAVFSGYGAYWPAVTAPNSTSGLYPTISGYGGIAGITLGPGAAITVTLSGVQSCCFTGLGGFNYFAPSWNGVYVVDLFSPGFWHLRIDSFPSNQFTTGDCSDPPFPTGVTIYIDVGQGIVPPFVPL